MKKVALCVLVLFAPFQVIAQSAEVEFDGGGALCFYVFIGNLDQFAQRCYPDEVELFEILQKLDRSLERRLLDAGLVTPEEIWDWEQYYKNADCTSSHPQHFLDQLVPQVSKLKKGLDDLLGDTRTPIRRECFP